LNEYKDAEIVRSRDMKIIDDCDIVVDVGAKFEPENKRFDHHQREFTDTMRSLNILNFDTKLSSAGLVYAFYGKAVINALTGVAMNSPECDTIYKKVNFTSIFLHQFFFIFLHQFFFIFFTPKFFHFFSPIFFIFYNKFFSFFLHQNFFIFFHQFFSFFTTFFYKIVLHFVFKICFFHMNFFCFFYTKF